MDMRNSKKSLVARVKYLEAKLERVYEAGLEGICYVARANYPAREIEATAKLQDAMWKQEEE